MKSFVQLVTETLESIEEIFPWDLSEELANNPELILLDIREEYEFNAMRIENSLLVPRGILESACEFGYEETVPELAKARERKVIVICKSGNRSALAAATMQQMGFKNVLSLKTGLRGWNDDEQPLIDHSNKTVNIDFAEEYFTPKLTDEQMAP